MLRRSSVLWRLLAVMLALVVVAGACGGDDDDDTSSPSGSEPAEGEGGGASGEIVISGSSTVEPISAAVAAAFNESNPDVAISVSGPGTGDGFAQFCAGETDVSDASRAIDEEEVAACEEGGIEFIELKVGIDGLSVITSHDNDAITCLSFADLYALLGPESTDFNNWNAADGLAGELPTGFGELHTPYPDADLVITAPGEESGTYDSFVEIALEGIAEERGQDPVTRPDYTASPNDNVIIEGVAGSPSSLGWVGFAFAEGNADVVKLLEVDGGEGCVAPTPETISANEFPLSRDLYIYINAANAEENAALASFVDFYLSDEGIASVTDVGYVALHPDALEATRAAWEAKTTGTQAG